MFGDHCVDVRISERAISGRGIVVDFFERALSTAPELGVVDTTSRRNPKAGVNHLIAVAAVLARCRAELGDDEMSPV